MMYTFTETIGGSDITIFEHENTISLTIVQIYKDKNKTRKSKTANVWLKKDTAKKLIATLTDFVTS